METEKLTLRIAMMYPEAMIKCFNGDEFNQIIYPNLTNLILSNPYDFQNIISDCKLILRQLSRLTDEEKRILLDIVRDINVHKQITANYYYDVLINYSQQKIFDKLREWNIDFETPSLHERGIAVYE